MNFGQSLDMKACIVGGNWNNTSNAGVFAVNLNNYRTNTNTNIGARDSIAKPETTKVDTGNRGRGCPALSEIKCENSLSSVFENRVGAKRKGYLFEQAFTMENLYAAYLDARKGKRKKRATMKFETNLGAELQALYDELHSGSYEPRPYSQFYVYEPKPRLINAPHFRDLVVQHAIYRTIYDLFDKTFIDTSYACRKGGGTHKASAYTQKSMRKYSGDLYYAKLDIRKFFYRIDREILRKLFEKKIKDRRFIDLMCMFAQMNGDKGIPIGNLLSQLYALIYLNPLDYFIKRELKIKHYVRYVDDFVMIGLTLDEAKEAKTKCEKFLEEKLNLELSHWTIEKIRKGINFVGYRTWRGVKFVRKHSMYKFRKAIKEEKFESIVSLIGHAKGTGTIPYYRKMLIKSNIVNQIPKRSLNYVQICAV